MNKILKKLFLLILISAALLPAQSETWEIFGTMPRHVSGAGAFAKDNNIYLFGGYSDSTQKVVKWIQKYQVLLELWKQIGELEYPRISPVVKEYNDTAYIFGGVDESDFNKRSTISKWSLEPNSFVFDTNAVFDKYLAEGNIVEGIYYLIGGNLYDKNLSDSSYITGYDLRTNEVVYRSEKIFPGLKPNQQMSAAIGKDIYIFGGVLNGILSAIYKFDTVSKQFTTLKITMLEPRAGGRAIYDPFGDQILIIGGYNESFSALKSVESFSIIEGQPEIKEFNNLNFRRTNFSTAFINNSIYVLGGVDEVGNPLREIEKYETGLTSVENETNPINYNLKQNYPNPFNPATIIEYSIPGIGNEKFHSIHFVKLIVYDILGREVTVLVNEKQSPGNYKIRFSAEDLPSGVYLYKLSLGDFTQTKKMILLR